MVLESFSPLSWLLPRVWASCTGISSLLLSLRSQFLYILKALAVFLPVLLCQGQIIFSGVALATKRWNSATMVWTSSPVLSRAVRASCSSRMSRMWGLAVMMPQKGKLHGVFGLCLSERGRFNSQRLAPNLDNALLLTIYHLLIFFHLYSSLVSWASLCGNQWSVVATDMRLRYSSLHGPRDVAEWGLWLPCRCLVHRCLGCHISNCWAIMAIILLYIYKYVNM